VTGELEGELASTTENGGLLWTLKLPAVEIEEIPHLALS
jgi:hypothetical protein